MRSTSLAASISPAKAAPSPADHWSVQSLPSQLNSEWQLLCGQPQAARALARWSSTHSGLAGHEDLHSLLRAIQRGPNSPDPTLLALLELAQAGDRLAGRVVLQAMLGAAVRLAGSIVRRPDVLGDRDEAQSTAIAALWQVISTYPLQARPRRVVANLVMDTLALVQRGHTGSSHFARTFPEQSFGDVTVLGPVPHHDDPDLDETAGPADAELLTLLAWSVRSRVISLEQARLLARVYAVDGGGGDRTAIAADLGLTEAALRQRCHRLARRLRQAAVPAGFAGSAPVRGGAVLVAA